MLRTTARAALVISWLFLLAGELGAGDESSALANVHRGGQVNRVDGATPRDLQIEMAKAAGPPVSGAAAIYVLGPKGYERAREGTNGFSCLIERQRPDTMEPECYDAEGSATTLPVRFFVEAERALGKDEARIDSEVDEGYKSGRFVAPRKGGIVYMLSDVNYVLDPASKQIIHFPGHLMFYAPYATAKEVGSGPGAPYLTSPGRPDNVMIVVPAGGHSH